MKHDTVGIAEFQQRRKDLIQLIKETHGVDKGVILLFAAFEQEHARFRQESSFYYLTGITEPGVVLWLDLENHATLFIPNHGTVRSQWVQTSLAVTDEAALGAGVDTIEYLGQHVDGYQSHPFFKSPDYEQLLMHLKQTKEHKINIFSLKPATVSGYVEQRFILERLNHFLPGLYDYCVDISPLMARLRRTKSLYELEMLFKAVEITQLAQEAAAQVIEPGKQEYEIQAAIEYIFTEAGAQRPSFPTIVGSGKNSTVLHYTDNDATLQPNDVVVVDIGAEYHYYCADLTRTYPVSGMFTDRQRTLYDAVLDTQEYIATIAKPGYWLSNKDEPTMSLNHLARAFLKERGCDRYFPHGIGHFLGLDVHDVGDGNQALKEGDIITIEPGIYIPEERIGIRIEDNYWVVKDGVVCLSEHLPKKAQEVEKMVREKDHSHEHEHELDDGYDA